MMASYNFYEIDNLPTLEDKKYDNDLFGFNSIEFKKINDDFNGFIFYTCHIAKDYRDTIYVYDVDGYKENATYRRIGKIDLFIKDKIIFARGSYIDRGNFDRALKNLDIANFLCSPKHISLNLLEAVKFYEKFKSLSIKDFSATISKLKTSGQMNMSDTDITDFISRSDDITATTIVYPFNDDEYDIHIDKECRIRLKDGDFNDSIETQLDMLSSFNADFIQKYRV